MLVGRLLVFHIHLYKNDVMNFLNLSNLVLSSNNNRRWKWLSFFSVSTEKFFLYVRGKVTNKTHNQCC